MLQVSVQGLDRLLIRLVSLDVLIELLHVCIKAGRAECLLREPRRAYGGKCEQHFSHGDGEPADQRKPRTSGPRPKKACRMEEREKGRNDVSRGFPSGRRGETAYLLLARRERTPPNLTPCQQCLNEVLPRVAKDKIPRDITTSALRNRADKTELFI